MTVVQILYSGLGGHSSVSFSLVEADEQRTYEHVLIFYGIEDLPQAYKAKCIELGVRFFAVKKNPGFDPSSQKEVAALLKHLEPDVILLHSINLLLPVWRFSLFRKTRLIAVEHQPNHLKTNLEWIWSFLAMYTARHVVFLTDMYYTQMQRKIGLFFRKKKVGVINNGINMKRFRSAGHERPADTGIQKIGMLARLTDTKDHATLLNAFKLLVSEVPGNGFKLYIAGDGDKKASLEEQSRKLGLAEQICFEGMLAEAESVDFLKGLDIYVHASLGETMSTSIMQAMACGKPIVASDVPGVNNMIRHQVTGLLVPSQQAEEMKIAILRLIQDKNLRQELSAHAAEFAEKNYSNKKMLENYSTVFSN
jgi:glycosyltransferase involved in cell wall biosynthesis